MNKIIGFLGMIVLFCSCGSGLRYFSQDMYNEYRWTKEELKSIQFYLSQDIVLWRKLSDEDTRITNGKIRVVDDSEIEEVIIKEGTPGIVLFSPKRNKFAVSFDRDDSSYLMFGPNPKANNRYVLLAKEWDRRQGKISYGDRIYTTGSESAFAALKVDIKRAKKIKYSSKRASGRRVSDP